MAASGASAGAAIDPRDGAHRPARRQRDRLREAHRARRGAAGRPGGEIGSGGALADRRGRAGVISEPKGRGAAWTEERGTSDEGRRCSEGGWGGGWGPGGEQEAELIPRRRKGRAGCASRTPAVGVR